MNAVPLALALGISGILASYLVARIIAAVIARADKREEQRPDYLADDPRIVSLFTNHIQPRGD